MESTAVADSLQVCMLQLDILAKKVKVNNQGIDQKQIDAWKASMLKVTEDMVHMRKYSKVAKDSADGLIQRHSLEDAAEDVVVATIKEKIAQEMATFDSKQSEEYTKIKNSLYPDSRRSSGMDDDLEIVEDENVLQVADMKCPYSQQAFTEPMKNANCSHRIDRPSFEAMMKDNRGSTSSFNCVVSGCKKTWSRQSASIDRDFMMKLERQKRIEQSMGHSSSSSSSAAHVEMLDEDDDEGYTLV